VLRERRQVARAKGSAMRIPSGDKPVSRSYCGLSAPWAIVFRADCPGLPIAVRVEVVAWPSQRLSPNDHHKLLA